MKYPGLCFAISVYSSTSGDYEVSIHMDDQDQTDMLPPQLNDPVNKLQRAPNKAGYDLYKDSGFFWIQNLISNAILRRESGNNAAFISNVVLPMKSSEYLQDDLAENLPQVWGTLMVIIFVAPIYRLVYNIVGEKQQKVRELMKIMGLTDTPYWLSWFMYYTVIMTGICFILTLISIFIFKYSNWIIIYLYYWCYGMSLFGYSMFMASFFSN